MKVTRNSDITIRFSEEEFFVILPNMHLKGAMKIAQKIRERIRNLDIYIKNNIDKLIKFTISIGIMECYCDDDQKVDAIVRRAEKLCTRLNITEKIELLYMKRIQ